MSDHIEGIVARISAKAGGRSGDKVYNICMEIDGEDDAWFGHGFDEPVFQEGDEIEFDVEYNGDFENVDKETVNIISEGSPKPKSRSRSGGSSRSKPNRSNKSSSSRAKPSRGGNRAAKPAAADDKMSKEEWAQKDQMIRRLACMNTSIKLCTLLIAEGAVTIPKKKSDAYDAVVALCDEEAGRLYDQYEEQVYGSPKSAGRGRNKPANNDYDDDVPY
jgi:hypothetical protein